MEKVKNMLTPTKELLQHAERGGYALGAFNVYNLEGVKAVIAAAVAESSPVMLQLHPSALKYGGSGLVALCLAEARSAPVPAAVHLDHSASHQAIRAALEAGVSSVMADGSHLSYSKNQNFTREMSTLAHTYQSGVEAELGRLSGTEDGFNVPEYEARLTDPDQAAKFVAETGVDALAVCIGNVHGKYPGPPRLDFERLARIHQRVSVPLVLHGASGLPDDLIDRSIELGIRKFNVNTEIRTAYLESLRTSLAGFQKVDLLDVIQAAVAAMQTVIAKKLHLFGSAGQAAQEHES
jgi:tagatose 1,6-diphosphate aldolase GatY/KbaY